MNTLRKSKAIRRLRARREREAALKLDIERGKSYRSGLVDGVEGQPEYHVETVDGPQPRRIVTIGRHRENPEWYSVGTLMRHCGSVKLVGDCKINSFLIPFGNEG